MAEASLKAGADAKTLAEFRALTMGDSKSGK